MEPKVVRTWNINDMLQLRFIEVAPRTIVRGVWSRRAIREGELIEVCPVVPIYMDENPSVHRVNAVKSYAYNWHVRDDDGNLVVGKALAMGMAAIYNHAEPGNIYNKNHYEEFMVEFYAREDIEPDTELTHDYGWGSGAGARLNPVDRFLRPIPKSRIAKMQREGLLDPDITV